MTDAAAATSTEGAHSSSRRPNAPVPRNLQETYSSHGLGQCAKLIAATLRLSRSDIVHLIAETAVVLKSCPDCAAQMPNSAAFCPGCGHSVQTQPVARQLGVGRENLLGALTYFTFLPALAFLLLDPYRKNSFLRHHSVQCLSFWLVSMAATVLVRCLVWLLLLIPIVGPLLALLLVTIAALAALFTWIVLLVKAFQGERFRLPVIGDLAEHYSGPS